MGKDVINYLDYGKMPPSAVDLEEAVLGACILEKDAILNIIDIIKPESFYKYAHQKIYSSILNLSMKLQPIDIMTVTEKLRNTGELEEVGGAHYILQLTTRVASSSHVEHHARIIAEKYIQRELIRISSEIQQKAYDYSIDVDDLIDFSEKELFKIAEGNIKKDPVKIETAVKDSLKKIEEISKNDNDVSGVPSGFSKIDRIINGWQPSDLVIVAARPSMGKTAFVLSMLRNISIDYEIPTAIFSLEMSTNQLTNRWISGEAGIPANNLRSGKIDNFQWEILGNKLGKLTYCPIFIDDTPAISVFELRAKCRRLKMKHDIQLICIDYLQLMSGDKSIGNREQQVSFISRSLKAIAKELDIPIIALSQLNRAVEVRTGNKRPQLSDLRESGAIEQDADVVIFIHRPEKYGFLEDEEGNSLKGLAEIIIAKHRNGALGDVNLQFKADEVKFIEPDDEMTFKSNDFESNSNFDNEPF